MSEKMSDEDLVELNRAAIHQWRRRTCRQTGSNA